MVVLGSECRHYNLGCSKNQNRDFPGGPVAKTLHLRCRGPGVPSLVGELDPRCCH